MKITKQELDDLFDVLDYVLEQERTGYNEHIAEGHAPEDYPYPYCQAERAMHWVKGVYSTNSYSTGGEE